MNILYFSPSNTIGGAELSLLGILTEANKHGHMCYVALPPAKRGDTSYMEMLKQYCTEIYIVRPMRWHTPRGLNWKQRIISYLYHIYLSGWHVVPVFKLLRIIRKHKIDIVHTNTCMAIDPSIAAKLTATPHVWHIREGVGYSSDAIVRFPFQKFPGLFLYVMDQLSSKIITNSQFTASLARPYFPEDKTQVIYNSLPCDWFVKKQRKSNKVTTVVGMIGNVTAAWKNHKLVIEVANVLRSEYSDLNVMFHIYGSLPDDDNPYYVGLLNKTKSLQLTNTVLFRGREEPEKLYNGIDILFHPCNREPFGRIFIEAMGKGVPVVAVRGGGADELIEDGRTGYKVEPDSPEQAANRIAELIRKPSIYRQMSLNGFEYASSQFKSSVMWKKMENLYRSVI